MGQESGEMKHTVQRVNSAAHDIHTHAETHDSADPDEIRGNIEQTRSSMSETIDALQERLNPQHLVDEAKESLRGATIGKVEDMMDSARDSMQGASNGIMGTIRDNPVPVALVGIGLGWLFLRGRNRSQPTSIVTNNRSVNGYYTDRGYDAFTAPYGQNYNRGYPQPQQEQPTTNGVADKANQMAGQAQDKLHDMGGKAQDTMQQVAGQAQDTMQQFGGQAQYQAQQARGWFEDNLRENPFAVGAVALAVGALVGLAIPETPQENQLLGDTRDSLMDKAQDAAQDTLQKVQSVAQETTDAAKQAAQQAAQRQGLTGNGNTTPSTTTPTSTANGTSTPSRS